MAGAWAWSRSTPVSPSGSSHRRRPGWPGLRRKEDQIQMGKHCARDIGIGQEGDDAHLATAVLANKHVDLKDPLQKGRPVESPRTWKNGKSELASCALPKRRSSASAKQARRVVFV